MRAYHICFEWTIYNKIASLFVSDFLAELNYSICKFIGQSSEPLMCRLEDGIVFSSGISMIMFHADPLMKRVTEIIDRLVEASIHSHWNSKCIEYLKLKFRKISIVQTLDEYCSFNLYNLQPAFYLLLIGWCLSAFCFIAEVFYNRVLSQRTWILKWVNSFLNLSMAVITQDYVNHNTTATSLGMFQRVN